MMSFIAYALLIIGVPMYVGAFAAMATAPLAWPFPDSWRRMVLEVLKTIQGIIAIGAALLLFRFCSVRASIVVLAVSLIWISLYYSLFKQPFVSWLMHAAGILVGWFLCFPHLHA
jgi:hypothetical protein